ncbi:MAG TPA: di-heme oxidoredictase family protein [Kofleriaceae bacterium]|nr:di-heme oxidoredictase family protein [Kofleriaceae bacterium]
MKWIRNALIMSTVGGGVLAGCGPDPAELPMPTSITQQSLIGDALAGITAADFAAAKAAFNTVEGLDDGLGPIFNEKACGNCHTQGASGGAGVQIERRFGAVVNGVFKTLSNEGGSLRQLFTVGTFTGTSGQTCTVPLEHEPADATVHNVGRLTTPLFGLGLVDSLPDSVFDSLAANEPAAVRGLVNRVKVLLPNPNDPTQSVGSTRVGRFGWKGAIATLVQFAADAYLNEMGITTQHCLAGVSVLSFATESKPNGVAQPVGCDDRGAGGPGIPIGTDDGVGSCAGGLTEIQDDVELFTDFMTFLAPPAPATIDPVVAQQAFDIGSRIGCADCHFPGPYTTPAVTYNGVPANMQFFPGSDFLVHDMGSLGDMIGNDGDTVAQTRLMRTAPLWGLRFRTKFLHDGRATTITAAIQAHAGQGAAAATAFNALSASDKSILLQGLSAL